MNPEFDDVLLTAYLDNEVTEAERARVEVQLRASESSRLLLEDLRSVRKLVERLHLSQPSRNFQTGPWNEKKATNQSSPVVLNMGGSEWKFSSQRLASIAALIAIAVCTGVLLLGPNRNSISRLDRSSSDVSSLGKSDADVELFRPQGGAGARLDNLQTGRATEDAPVDSPGAVGDSGAALAKQKDFRLEKKDVELIPAPVVVDPSNNLALGLPKPEEPLQRSQRAEPSAKSLLESLFERQTAGSSEWEVLDSLRTQDSYSFQNDQSADFVQQNGATRSTGDESITRFSFRYKPTTEPEMTLAEKRHDKDASISPAVKTKDENVLMDSVMESKQIESEAKRRALSSQSTSNTLIVEFQIPSEDWENGAKRLRDLGVEVPLELPESVYLDFVASPTEAAKEVVLESDTNAPVNRLRVAPKVSGSRELSRWIFQRPEQLGRVELELRPMRESDTNKEAEPTKSGSEWNKANSSVRIRVHAIKK